VGLETANKLSQDSWTSLRWFVDLFSTTMELEGHQKPNGLPGVMTWIINPTLKTQNIKRTVMRTTRPAWEDFKPMYTIVNKMRRANDSTASLNAAAHFLIIARLVFPRETFKLQPVAMLA